MVTGTQVKAAAGSHGSRRCPSAGGSIGQCRVAPAKRGTLLFCDVGLVMECRPRRNGYTPSLCRPHFRDER